PHRGLVPTLRDGVTTGASNRLSGGVASQPAVRLRSPRSPPPTSTPNLPPRSRDRALGIVDERPCRGGLRPLARHPDRPLLRGRKRRGDRARGGRVGCGGVLAGGAVPPHA